ncbi:hypothetical protein L1049_022629 [Liquidambar formosana]|uniref:Protein kinase domain-containing protein n=1 Tax=Liquidambar formosana TaxID=63359 RepID=A0AAP0WRT5_LIQFO
MATPHLFFFFSLIFLCNPHKIHSSTCTLDFSQFPYEAQAECFDIAASSFPVLSAQTCCRSALQSLFQSMAISANKSRSTFLEPAEAQDCSTTFQSLHNRIDLSSCGLQNFISASTINSCSKDVDSVINALGNERYNALQSNCGGLSSANYSDDACFNCLGSYRESLQALREADGSNGRGCGEALLVSLASSNIDSPNWVHGTFSCLWDEIEFPWPDQNQNKGHLLGSRKLLAIITVAVCLVIITPILYKITRKQLNDASEKEMDSLSVIILKKRLEDESRITFTCSDLYVFSQDEMKKATNSFDHLNLIREGTTGKFYVGIMPSGMRAAIKRINDGVKLHDFIDEICRKAKIRHPNLVSTLGYCDRSADQCLVYEYCVNGDLERWLLGERRTPILTWEHRLRISIEIARGLWFLHNNRLEKMVHGDIKLTNILLNEKLEAKLSDSIFSKSKQKGPNGLDTMANDVFNFGVVLLQILTGRKPTSLVNEAREAVLKGGDIIAMADPHLDGAYISAEFQTILSLAVLCTTPNERERPHMDEILRKLEETQILV